MSLKLGTTSIGGVYKGTTKIDRIYKGTTLVYSSGTWEQWYQEFLYNALIPTTINSKQVKNKAIVYTVYGNSVVENQLVETLTYYGGLNVLSNSGSGTNEVTVVANGNGNITVTFKLFNGGQQTSHYYLITYFVETNVSGMSFTSYFVTSSQNIIANSQNTFSTISTGSKINDLYLHNIQIAGNLQSGNTFKFKINVIDLTQKFPFNTPTALNDNRVQELLNRGYIPYNTGEIKSVDIGEISSEPYNLFDSQLEEGGLNSTTGATNTDDRFVRSANYIEVIGNTNYSIEQSGTINTISNAQRHIYEYDENHNFIQRTYQFNTSSNFLSPYSVTLTQNTKYIKIMYYRTISDVNYSVENVCFHRTGTRTGYAPYQAPQTITFKYQGSGVGTANDTMEITNTAYVFTKNMNEYTFTGNETSSFSYDDNYHRFFFNGLDSVIKNIVDATDLGNILSPLYPTNKQSNLGDKTLMEYNTNSNKIVFRDTSYSSITDFLNHISNSKLYYQLATPQTITIPKKHLGCVDLGTLTSIGRSNNGGAWNNYLFYVQISDLTVNTLNIFCSKYMNTTSSLSSMADKSIRISSNYMYIRDDSITSTSQFLTENSGIQFFYETENEVADIATQINIQAGGTITTNSEVLPNIDFGVKCK